MSSFAPLLTPELAGSGGVLRPEPEDFLVEEIPSYLPCGEGEHLLVEIEKIGLTTPDAIARIARAARVSAGVVGAAGMKDRSARTRQWLSLPLPVRAPIPDFSSVSSEGGELRVLRAERHRNKIKRGHQRGNRFTITIREVPEGGAERAQAVLERLRTAGVPNAFGAQRFGREGDNAERALAMIRGEQEAPRNRRIRDLLVSALQSAVFNRALAIRIDRGLFASCLAGDVMQKHATGGLFDVTDPAAEQPRVERLEISPTAALPGPRARKASGVPQEIEDEALAATGLSEGDVARLAEGTRRALRFPLDPEARITPGDGAYVLEVSLPSGAYATVLLAELIKPASGVVLREEGEG